MFGFFFSAFSAVSPATSGVGRILDMKDMVREEIPIAPVRRRADMLTSSADIHRNKLAALGSSPSDASELESDPFPSSSPSVTDVTGGIKQIKHNLY